MAALHTAPDSPAAQLGSAEDSSECDPDQEEEEEEKREEVEEREEEEEMVGEEAEDELDADRGQVEVELQGDEDVEVVPADTQSPELGTQERFCRSGDSRFPVLQGSGKKKLALGEGREVGGLAGRPGELCGPVGWSWAWDIRDQALKWAVARSS